MSTQIILRGAVIRTSRNLRSILRYSESKRSFDPSRVLISVIMVTRLPEGRATLSVLWVNGATCQTEFADFNICVDWCADRVKYRGWPSATVNQ